MWHLEEEFNEALRRDDNGSWTILQFHFVQREKRSGSAQRIDRMPQKGIKKGFLASSSNIIKTAIKNK